MRTGVDAWFEKQLNPASIPDPALEKRLADYPALQLSTPQLVEEFPTNQVVRQIADGKRPMPTDPTLNAVYEVLIAKQQRKQKEDQAAQAVAAAPATTMSMDNQMMAVQSAQKKRDPEAARTIAEQMLLLPREQRMAAILTLPLDQRIILASSVPDPQKGQLSADFTPRERELFAEMAGGPDAAHVIAGELQQAKVLRAILSERQLQEVMTDFWFNHFNVFLSRTRTSSTHRVTSGPRLAHALLIELHCWRPPSIGDAGLLATGAGIGPDSISAEAKANAKQGAGGRMRTTAAR